MQFIVSFFVYDEELKWSIQDYYFCLLANQLKVPTLVVWMLTCKRIYYVRTIVETLVHFEVRLSLSIGFGYFDNLYFRLSIVFDNNFID